MTPTTANPIGAARASLAGLHLDDPAARALLQVALTLLHQAEDTAAWNAYAAARTRQSERRSVARSLRRRHQRCGHTK
jgi:hypothetical protein